MRTVLVVDDDLDLLELYTDMLEIMGCHVLQAHEGEQALERARQERPDLIVTDWMMPGLDGAELCLRLLRDPVLRHIPIILHSSMKAPRLPGIHVLSKGCPLAEFEDAVAEALGDVPERLDAPEEARAAC